jgi:ribosomal protein L18
MEYHVPFHQRNQNTSAKPPVYIGFEVPRRPARRFSWIGFGGFMLVILSCGVLAPFSLIMSLIGLRKGPGFFSVAGAVLSTIALAGMAFSIFAESSAKHHRHMRHRQHVYHQQVQTQVTQTKSIMTDAEKEIRSFKNEHSNQLPADMTGSLIAVQFKDAWKKELRYETENNYCLLRSAGPDQEFETSDDLTRKIMGKVVTEYEISMN